MVKKVRSMRMTISAPKRRNGSVLKLAQEVGLGQKLIVGCGVSASWELLYEDIKLIWLGSGIGRERNLPQQLSHVGSFACLTLFLARGMCM